MTIPWDTTPAAPKAKPPIEIKATAVQSRYSETAMEWMIDGRFEIRWSPSEAWINLGIASHSALEWQLITSVMLLGARRTNGLVTFSMLNLTNAEVIKCDECDAGDGDGDDGDG